MSYDFYIQGRSVQGRSDLCDGALILSLNKSELDKVITHPFLKTSALENMLKYLTLDPNSQILAPNEMRKYIPLLKQEIDVIEKTFPNTKENPMIQNNFYLNEALSIFGNAAEVCVTQGRNFILNQTAEDVNSLDGTIDFTKEYNLGWEGALCSINSVTINYGNIKTSTYSGVVEWSDNVERSGGRDKWVAHPASANANLRHSLIIRPVTINCLTYGYNFTFIPDFDNFLRKHIKGTINNFKANPQ